MEELRYMPSKFFFCSRSSIWNCCAFDCVKARPDNLNLDLNILNSNTNAIVTTTINTGLRKIE